MADYTFETLFQNRIIPVEQGKTMYKEYTTHRAEPLQPILREVYDNSEFVDSKFVNFSLDDLKKYVSFLEHVQQQNPKKMVSGVRVYFAAYPNSAHMNNKPVKHPGQQTVFMVPTVNIGQFDDKYENMNNLPFFVKGTTENPYKGQFEIIGDLMLDYKKQERLNRAKTTLSQEDSSTSTDRRGPEKKVSTIFNEGQVAPPPN